MRIDCAAAGCDKVPGKQQQIDAMKVLGHGVGSAWNQQLDGELA